MAATTAISSHLAGVKTISPVSESKKKPTVGGAFGLGVHLMVVLGVQ